jgi:hypothetical protein
MIQVRSNNSYSTSRCGTKEYLRFAALQALMIIIAAILSGAVQFAAAQDIFGRIVGTITDSSGATIPDVKVTIVNEATQAAREIMADKNGYFVADELPVGT